MEERADQFREGLKEQLEGVKDAAVKLLQQFGEGIDTLKTEISEQLDGVKEQTDVADKFTDEVRKVKDQGLARIDQLQGQVQDRLAAMG
jgi:S-adenosylmethionine synthetase